MREKSFKKTRKLIRVSSILLLSLHVKTSPVFIRIINSLTGRYYNMSGLLPVVVNETLPLVLWIKKKSLI